VGVKSGFPTDMITNSKLPRIAISRVDPSRSKFGLFGDDNPSKSLLFLAMKKNYARLDVSSGQPKCDGNLKHEGDIEDTQPGLWILLVTLAVAGVDGLLFGYDTGVMNGVLVSIKSDLGYTLSDGNKELLTSITSVGALLSALLGGSIADKWGRKSVMWASTVVFTLGALIQAFSPLFELLVVGRFIVGLGVGAAAMVVPMYGIVIQVYSGMRACEVQGPADCCRCTLHHRGTSVIILDWRSV
jgi:Sugar (and other) transporter